jgi:hypothetical protein
MAYARLVADLVDHELDALREAVDLEPVREWIEVGGSVRRDRRQGEDERGSRLLGHGVEWR